MLAKRAEATRWLKDRVPIGYRRKLVHGRLAVRLQTARARTMPDFLIVGAQRCGTSSLYKYLGAHPQVIPSLRKETEYFSTRYTEGELWYRAHFPLRFRTANGRRVTFEATPDYLLDPRSARRAQQAIPEALVVAMVRNPIDRAYSQYQHNLRLGHEPLEFEAALDAEEGRLAGEYERLAADPGYPALPLRRHGYVARGRYAEQIRRWQDSFTADRVHVARFEDLIDAPADTLEAMERFLGIEAWLPASFANHSYGRAGKAREKPMPEAARRFLEAAFEAPNRDLEDLLGRSMGWTGDPEGRAVE